MSLVGKIETDVHLNASADQFYEFFRNKPHHVENITPGKVKGVFKHRGDFGKVGSIIAWHYVLEGKQCVGKEMIEHVDQAKNLIASKVIEGDSLNHYKSFKYTLQVNPKEKGSVAHWTIEYEKIHGRIPDPHSFTQLVAQVTREIDASLTQGQGHEEQLIGKVEIDVHINASADKFHEILSSKPHLIPNVSPGRIKHAIVDGNWGNVGSFITWHYVVEGKPGVVKQVIEAIDANKNLITLRNVEGDVLKYYKTLNLTIHAIPKGEGTLVHLTKEYEKLSGHISDPHTLLELAAEIARDIDALVAM